jgi:hypothetical protein
MAVMSLLTPGLAERLCASKNRDQMLRKTTRRKKGRYTCQRSDRHFQD